MTTPASQAAPPIYPGLRVDQIEVLHAGPPTRVGARRWRSKTWWVRCSCGDVSLRLDTTVRTNVETRHGCCRSCRAARVGASARRRQLRASWDASRTLYDPAEIEWMAEDVRQALADELGAPVEVGPAPEDLRRGQRGEVVTALLLQPVPLANVAWCRWGRR